MCGMLSGGGVLAIADVIQPSDAGGSEVAVRGWDAAVCKLTIELDGHNGWKSDL